MIYTPAKIAEESQTDKMNLQFVQMATSLLCSEAFYPSK